MFGAAATSVSKLSAFDPLCKGTAVSRLVRTSAMLHRKSTEYSLAELLEHPVLRVQMANEGIEDRSLDLILDTTAVHRRFSGTGSFTRCGFAYPCLDTGQ